MPFIDVNNLTYFYLRQGKGSPFVLLHGFTGSSENWLSLPEKFFAQHDVLLLDLPGHGQTDSPRDSGRYAMEHVARDLIDIFDAFHLPAVNLLGYSMGGRLALYLAANYPHYIGSLILESSSPGLGTRAEREERIAADLKLADEIEVVGVSKFIEQWRELPLFASQKNLSPRPTNALQLQRLNNSAIGLANSLRGMGTGQQPPLWSVIGSIQCPVLILAGRLDAKFTGIAKQMAATIPRAQLEIFDDAGHNIHLEQAQRFTNTVLSFLASSEQLANAEQQNKE